MNLSAAIHVASPAQFDPGAAQAPDAERRAAIAPTLGIPSAIWGGLLEVEPGSRRAGVHRHGEQETIAYVLSGICEIRWGKSRISRMRNGGRFHSRPPSCRTWKSIETEAVSVLVERGTATPIVVDLPNDIWP